MTSPPKTIRPKSTSSQSSFRLKKSGSMNATKRDVEARQVRVTDTVDTFKASKKKDQCAAITKPVRMYFKTFERSSRGDLFETKKKSKREVKAIDIR